MSDDKKPKKDLRARLGRTISPNTPGAPAIGAPAVGAAAPAAKPGAPVPAPVALGKPVAGGIAPPIASPVLAPPGGAGTPFGGGVAPPPFGQPRRSDPPKARAPSDPFASGPSADGPREVRLVIDDKPVDESEVGKRNRGRNFLLIGIGLALGALLGGGFGSMNARNTLYNVTVRDGHDIYDTVTQSSTVVLDAQTKIDRLVERASGVGGQPMAVDYETIQALQGIEIPIHAGAFARKNYGAFNPGTVDDLFAYYNNVMLLWERFQRLAAQTLPEAHRTELDRTSQMAGEVTSTFYGVIPQVTDDGLVATLVVLDPFNEATPTKRVVRQRRGATQSREMDLLTAESTITDSATFVIPTAPGAVLADQLGAFRQYVADIREIKALMDQTVEIQGRLTTSLGEIARLEEVFAF
jgi:hypothetical protein